MARLIADDLFAGVGGIETTEPAQPALATL